MMLKMAIVPPCAISALQTTHSEVVKYSIKSGTIENTTMTKIMLSPSSLLLGINKYKLMDRQTNIKIVLRTFKNEKDPKKHRNKIGMNTIFA